MPPLLFILHPQTSDHGVTGTRWAVHYAWESQVNDHPLAGCINAGWCSSFEQADAVGQLVLYSIMSFFRVASIGDRAPVVVNLRPDHDITDALIGDLEWVDVDGLVIAGVMG